MTNRQRAALATKNKLLDAAKKLIEEKGLAGTSVDEITEACGVAKGTFYTYFKRKEDIVFALSAGMFGEILENAKRAPGGAAEKLIDYMVHFSDCIEKSGVKLAQEWVKNVVDPVLCENGGDQKLQNDLRDMADLLTFLAENGQMRRDADLPALAKVLVDLAYGQMLCWCMSGGKYSLRERTAAFCRDQLAQLIQNYNVV